MKRLTLVFLFLVAALSARADDAKPTPATQARLGESVAPSLVRVEYTLQFDQGQAPSAAGWSTKCPNCGEYHGNDVSSVVQEDRPFETAGFLVAPDTVVTADPILHPRFLKKIAVSFGGNERVDAMPAGYARANNALVLKLATPLKSARALTFDPAKAGPYSAITYTQENGDWTTSVQSLGGTVSTTTGGRKFFAAASPAVVVAADGTPVALSMNGELPLDDSWKTPPAEWSVVSASDYTKLLEATRTATGKGLLRVTLNLRSPKASPAANRFAFGHDDDNDGGATVRHVTGVLLDGKTVLVLAELKSSVTGRLERIRVRQSGGQPVEAKFAHTLADYGAFVATLEKPLDGAIAAPRGEVRALRGVLLPAAQVIVQGEKRTEYIDHRRIASFNTGFRRQLYPDVGGGDATNVFLFDEFRRGAGEHQAAAADGGQHHRPGRGAHAPDRAQAERRRGAARRAGKPAARGRPPGGRPGAPAQGVGCCSETATVRSDPALSAVRVAA
jgi:hypothetical protein